MLDILFWAVITLIVLGSMLSILMIGKPREPMTPGSAVVNVMVNAFVIAVLMLIYQRSLAGS